jgi:hypothetical protein
MRNCLGVVLFGLATVTLGGCNNTGKVIPEPGKITLEDALESVGTGLQKLQAKNLKTGLIASEVDVTFNISANAKDAANGKLYVEAGASAAEVLKVTKAGAEAGFTSEITAVRGNTITVKFRNLLAQNTQNTLAGKLTDAQIADLLSNIKPFLVGGETK